MKKPLNRSRLIHLVPIILWISLIFVLSSQSYQKQDIKPLIQKELSASSFFNDTMKTRISETSFNYGDKEISVSRDGVNGFVEFIIRKLAHLFVYGILGLLVARILRRITSLQFGFVVMISVCVCSIYAASDEFHQSFVQGRTAMVTDVVLDTLGAAIGVLLYMLFSNFFQKLRRKHA